MRILKWTRVLKTLACRGMLQALVDSVSVRFKKLACRKVSFNIHMQSDEGNACVSAECVLKTLMCPDLGVGSSKVPVKRGRPFRGSDSF